MGKAAEQCWEQWCGIMYIALTEVFSVLHGVYDMSNYLSYPFEAYLRFPVVFVVCACVQAHVSSTASSELS